MKIDGERDRRLFSVLHGLDEAEIVLHLAAVVIAVVFHPVMRDGGDAEMIRDACERRQQEREE